MNKEEQHTSVLREIRKRWSKAWVEYVKACEKGL